MLIAGLLGAPQDTLPPFAVRTLPKVTARIPPTAGLDLVARRPDVAASRWRIEAARQELDVVRADYYPDVSIDALAGLQSITRNQLFTGASGVPALGLAVHLPLFDGGMRDARHGVASAQLTEAIAAYNSIIERHSGDNVAAQSKFALARLYEAQGNLVMARDYYMQSEQVEFGTISTQASLRLKDLFDKHPELIPGQPAASTNPPVLNLNRP